MKLALILALTIHASPASASFKESFDRFCAKYIFADDPMEGEETVAEAKERYGDMAREFLKDLYYSEINRPKPRVSVLRAIEREFGGKP